MLYKWTVDILIQKDVLLEAEPGPKHQGQRSLPQHPQHFTEALYKTHFENNGYHFVTQLSALGSPFQAHSMGLL